MMNMEQLQIEIESLPEQDFMRLQRWFAEKDWARWDKHLESDVTNEFQGWRVPME